MTYVASRRSSLIIALSSCLGAATALPASTASACSGNLCFPDIVAPDQSLGVPGNLPGFPFTAGRGGIVDAGAGAGPELQLLGPDGQPVPTDLKPVLGAVLLAPRQPLDPGNYRLRWLSSCVYSSPTQPGTPGPPMEQERMVTVTTAVPLPTTIGELFVGVGLDPSFTVTTTSGSCTAQVTASVATFKIYGPPELHAFLPVARLLMKVDGQPWAASQWGGGTIIPTSIYYQERRPDAVYTLCATPVSGASGADRGVPEGHHHAELTVEIPGTTATIPPVSVDFDTSCAMPDGGPPPGDGYRDGGVPDAAAPAPDATAPAVTPPSPSSGCAYSPGAGSRATLPTTALALLIARLARRRRSPLPSDRRPRPWWPTR